MGKILVAVGLLTVALGIAIIFLGRVPGIGNVPGDIVIQGERFTVYIPVVSLAVFSTFSITVTLLLNLIARLFRG